MLMIGGSFVRIAKRRFRRLRLTWFSRIRQDELRQALRAVVPAKCNGLFVHSSLGRCGYFVGGCDIIVRALRETTENLCMPTHTYCYPKDRETKPQVFDPRETPSLVGALTEHFRRIDGAQRSLHPTHSIAAVGPMASSLISGHEKCATPCGDGTPYARMIEADFSVLMLGATLNAYTFFHTAEHDAQVPYLYFPEPLDLRVRDAADHEIQVKMLRQDMSIPRRFAEMDRELEAEGLLRRIKLGRGELLSIPSSRSAHQFLVELLRRDPYHLVQGR
jgi:aminoglycoside 3-N-acetyltransferase